MLVRTLAALQAARVPDDCNVSLLVVDNASNDGSGEAVKQFRNAARPVDYYREERRGLSYARNTGVSCTHGEIIMFTDDDVIPPKDWIERMCRPIIRGEADAIAGGYTTAPHLLRDWMSWCKLLGGNDSEWMNEKTPQEMQGLNMAFHRRVLERVPAFDTEIGAGRLGFSEDVLFGKQLVLAGYRLRCEKYVRVEHHYPADRLLRTQLLARSESFGRTEAYLAHHWKHELRKWCRLKLIKTRIRLLLFHVTNWHERSLIEACSHLEAELHYRKGFLSQYIVESRRRRNYSRFGITKVCRGKSSALFRGSSS